MQKFASNLNGKASLPQDSRFGTSVALLAGTNSDDGIMAVVVGAPRIGDVFFLSLKALCPPSPPSPPPSLPLPPPSPPSPPPPPGRTVSITFTLDISIASFDNVTQASFIDRLATFLGIPSFNVQLLSVTAGSTAVMVEIYQRESDGDFRAFFSNTPLSTLTAALGVAVLSIDDGVATASSEPSSSQSTGSSDETPEPADAASAGIDTIALVAGVTAAAAVLGASLVVAFIYRRKKIRKAHDRETIASSLAFSESFSFPLHLCTATDFVHMGSLKVFEEVRMAGQHRVVDLVEDAQHLFGPSSSSRLIFLSHQVPSLLVGLRLRFPPG